MAGSVIPWEQTSLGVGISPSCCKILNELATQVDLSPGQVLFREGMHNRMVYVILSGQLDLSMTVPGRGLVRMLSLGAGDLVAWSSIVGDQHMTSTATAVDSTQLVALPSDLLEEQMSHDHEFGYQLMRAVAIALSRRLVATRLQLLDLFASIQPEQLQSPSSKWSATD